MGCVRGGLGVVVGYGAMVVLIFSSLLGAYLALGTEGAFKEGSFEVSTVWNVMSLVIGFVVALVGGWVCTKIAPSKGALTALILVVFILGAASIATAVMAPDPGPRDEELASMEAMMQAVTPVWVAVANLVIGVVGAWLGGKGNVKSNPA